MDVETVAKEFRHAADRWFDLACAVRGRATGATSRGAPNLPRVPARR